MRAPAEVTPDALRQAAQVAVLHQQMSSYAKVLPASILSPLSRVLVWSTAWVNRQDANAPRWIGEAAAELERYVQAEGHMARAFTLRTIRTAVKLRDGICSEPLAAGASSQVVV